MSINITIQEVKEKLSNFKGITPWEKVEINGLYHIPPIASLKRNDVIILSKDDSAARYRKIGSEKESTMSRFSVFAKLLVKRKAF